MSQPLKVMIVDDDKVTLDVLSAVLEEQGHEVVPRDTAIGTMVAIIREVPDVVLLDVQMPGLTGDRLATLISERAVNPAPLIVLLSSTAQRELDVIAQRSGAGGGIEKTTDPAEFIRRFDAIVSQRLKRRATPESGRR